MEIVNGVLIAGVTDMREEAIRSQNENMTPQDYAAAGLPVPPTEEGAPPDPRTIFTSSLAGHILKEFYHNRDARRNSQPPEDVACGNTRLRLQLADRQLPAEGPRARAQVRRV